MKYFFTILVLSIFFQLLTPVVFAITPTNVPIVSPTQTGNTTPTTTPKIEKDLSVLEDLKDQIASRVAQLNLVQKKGFIGTINTISGTQITITDLNNQERIINVDELTKFSSPTSKDFGISDLSKGMTISILGIYNKQTKHTLARFLEVATIPRFLQGEIASIDATQFVIYVIDDKGTLTPVDVENVTKTSIYTKEDGLQKTGFSKIEQSKQVIVVGFSDKKDPKRIVATRVLVFPQATKNPRIIIPQEALEPQDTVTPSTGSGKKLTPIIR